MNEQEINIFRTIKQCFDDEKEIVELAIANAENSELDFEEKKELVHNMKERFFQTVRFMSLMQSACKVLMVMPSDVILDPGRWYVSQNRESVNASA